jgi:hypothetical protein
MSNNETLYIASEDLYRLGNAGSSLISRVRAGEIDINELNGIKVVVANGKESACITKQVWRKFLSRDGSGK